MDIEQKTEKFVVSLLKEKLLKTYVYHNINHTRRVLKYANELIEAEGIEVEDALVIRLAALLHDTGYVKSNENHEVISAKLAKDFLEKEHVSKLVLDKVQKCILATNTKIKPSNILEKIIVDADSAHLGNKNYVEVSELLREEWSQQGIKTLSDLEWVNENITYFTDYHQYYTNYALINWQKAKEKHLAQLYKLKKKLQKEEKKEKLKYEELQLKKQKARTPERGIETMFRVTLKNHMTLSNIADQKANILLSVNALMISIVVSNLIPKLDNPSNQYLIIPTAIFIFFSLIAMALSVITTRPNIITSNFTKEDIKNKKVNLLFFGNFHKLSLEDFEQATEEMMNDRKYLYSSMKKDLYFLGLVLHKKFKILRWTYSVFLIGIIISVLSFAIALKLQ
jgi:putative nucleotidyltransferase with HDIG domain